MPSVTSPIVLASWAETLGEARGQKVSGSGTTGLRLCFFADYVVLLASSIQDLQCALGRFAAECEAAGIRVGGELKYLRVLITSEGKLKQEIDWRVGAASTVVRSLYWSVMVKKELNRKAKLSIYPSIFFPTLNYGHKLWVVTERKRLQIQVFPPQGGWAYP